MDRVTKQKLASFVLMINGYKNILLEIASEHRDKRDLDTGKELEDISNNLEKPIAQLRNILKMEGNGEVSDGFTN